MFRSKCLHILIFVCGFVSTHFAQYTAPNPKWTSADDIKSIDNIDTKTVKDGYYYVLVSEQYNYLLKHSYFHYATKVVSEAGLDVVSQLEVNFDPTYEKAFFHFIKIHRNGEVLDKTNSSSYKTLNEETERYKGILSGKKTYYRNLDDLRKGDIVEYAYSIVGNNPIFNNEIDHHFFFSYSVPVGKLHYQITLPNDKVVAIKDINNPNYKPTESTLDKGKRLDWIIVNPPIVKIEEHTPIWHEPYAQVQISSIKSWEEVKGWSSSMFVLENQNSKDIDALVNSVINKYPDNKAAQITELVDFTQNQIRYSGNEQGIYSHRPHQPDFVLKNRFGDCKDKSFFLSVLLEKIDVICVPVLLNTSIGKHITDFLPSYKKFDHCICAIKYNGKYVFIDPTITMQKGSFLMRKVPDYQKCLILDSSKEVFCTIPSDFESKSIFKEYFDIDESGDAILKCTSLYYGSHADNQRYTFASNSLPDVQESYKSYYLRYSDDVTVLDSMETIDDTLNNIFTVKESYVIKRFWALKDNEKEISQSILPASVNERIRYVEEKSRKSPLKLYFPVNTWQEITINKKGGWNIKDEIISESNKFFDYEYKTTVKGTEIILGYHYFNKVEYVMPEDYELYKEKTEFLDKNIVFSPLQTIISTDGNAFNWLLASTILIFLGLSIYLGFKFYKKTFNYNHIETHTSIGGWLVLVSLGICLTPLVVLVQMILILKDDLFSNAHLDLLDRSSTNYDPFRAGYSLLANGCNTFLFVGSIFLIFIFFQRKNSFRPYYVFFKSFNLLVLFADLLVLYHYSGENSLDNSAEITKETTAFVRMFIQSCIWIPYIWISERSKGTFTVGNLKPEIQEKNISPEGFSNSEDKKEI